MNTYIPEKIPSLVKKFLPNLSKEDLLSFINISSYKFIDNKSIIIAEGDTTKRTFLILVLMVVVPFKGAIRTTFEGEVRIPGFGESVYIWWVKRRSAFRK